MARRSRLSSWWRARRRRNAASRNTSPLREFVYLDEVSVYSLLASRKGAIATEFTETEIASLQTEISASGSVGVPGVARGDARSTIGSTQSQQTQVVRKALVQSAFKELVEYEHARVQLRIPPGEEPPTVDNPPDLLTSRELTPWVVNADTLDRGDLLEAEIELAADGIFRMSAVISALTEIVKESPEFEGAAGPALHQVAAIARIIERLLVGLVPLRGRVVDFEVAVHPDGTESIVHSSVLNQRPADSSLQRLPLYVVGVAEEGLFWKDVRRVLFSNSRYQMLCRVARPGTQHTWVPVKLTDVLRDFLPDLAQQLDNAVASMVAAAQTSQSADAADPLRVRLHQSLIAYAEELATIYTDGIIPPKAVSIADEAVSATPGYGVEERRRAFAQITNAFNDEPSVTIDPVAAAQLRSSAWLESDATAPAPESTGLLVPPDERYLDAEFIAIYW